ncbi:hypothetical protein SNE40_018193 [Patella caerulea]|uniref:Uncharacterized protein n=1 Tax=Patella caerulea TaxID=87958 RepID=A0AAN8J8B7_PATCE
MKYCLYLGISEKAKSRISHPTNCHTPQHVIKDSNPPAQGDNTSQKTDFFSMLDWNSHDTKDDQKVASKDTEIRQGLLVFDGEEDEFLTLSHASSGQFFNCDNPENSQNQKQINSPTMGQETVDFFNSNNQRSEEDNVFNTNSKQVREDADFFNLDTLSSDFDPFGITVNASDDKSKSCSNKAIPNDFGDFDVFGQAPPPKVKEGSSNKATPSPFYSFQNFKSPSPSTLLSKFEDNFGGFDPFQNSDSKPSKDDPFQNAPFNSSATDPFQNLSNKRNGAKESKKNDGDDDDDFFKMMEGSNDVPVQTSMPGSDNLMGSWDAKNIAQSGASKSNIPITNPTLGTGSSAFGPVPKTDPFAGIGE